MMIVALTVVMIGNAIVGAEIRTPIILAQDEFDNTANGIRTMGGGYAVGQHFDTFAGIKLTSRLLVR